MTNRDIADMVEEAEEFLFQESQRTQLAESKQAQNTLTGDRYVPFLVEHEPKIHYKYNPLA